MRLTDFDVLTFDCYGTLIDWETGMLHALEPLTATLPHLSRNQVLEAHALHESAQQRQTPAKPYRDILAIVYKRLAEQWGIHATHDACAAYGRSVATWPAFDDSPAALRYLERFYKLVILSNVDNHSFEASRHRLQVTFDAVVTAEDAGSYKPDIGNFEYLLDRLAPGLGGPPIAKPQILHVAESLFHDHQPANAFGLATCWIHRRHSQDGHGATPPPANPPHLDFHFTGMAELADAHRRQLDARTS